MEHQLANHEWFPSLTVALLSTSNSNGSPKVAAAAAVAGALGGVKAAISTPESSEAAPPSPTTSRLPRVGSSGGRRGSGKVHRADVLQDRKRRASLATIGNLSFSDLGALGAVSWCGAV